MVAGAADGADAKPFGSDEDGGTLTAAELTAFYLNRIERLNPVLRAVISVSPQAAAELPTLRTIAAAEIHNLVFQTEGDYRTIPALLNRPSR